MITQQLHIRNSKRRHLTICICQKLSVKDIADTYTHKGRGINWQQRRLLRYTNYPAGVGQKLNGERVNFQALPTVRIVT